MKLMMWFLIPMLLLAGCTSQQLITPAYIPSSKTPTPTISIPTASRTPTISAGDQAAKAAQDSSEATSQAIRAIEATAIPECGYSGLHVYSPDGNWVAFECLEPGMGIYNLHEPATAWYLSYYETYGMEYQNGNHFGKLRPRHWSGDGKYLYFTPFLGGDGGCAVYYEGYTLLKLDLSTGVYTDMFAPSESSGYYNFSFSNGDTYLAYFETWREQQALTLLDMSSGKIFETSLDPKYSGAGRIIWSPDNMLVAFSAQSGAECETMTYDIIVLDMNTHRQRSILSDDPLFHRPIQWLDENHILVSVRFTEEYYALNIQTGELSPHVKIIPSKTP